MNIFVFNLSNQRLRRFTSGVIYANSYGKTIFKFNFNTPDWDSVTKTAVFSCRGENYPKPLDENNMCKVPKEVLHEGYFTVSVYGSSTPTNMVRIPVVDAPEELLPETPNMGDNESVPGINIFDGGAIILNSSDGPIEDDDSNSSDEESVVDYIMGNNIPFYSGLAGDKLLAVAYQQLPTESAEYTDQGFYITVGGNGKLANAGYQMTFEGNTENRAQIFAIYSDAKIVAAYQYQPAFDQWLDMGFDGVYWVEDGTMTQTINGKQIPYTTYVYNVELMGDVIISPEYWRFEVEVT